MKFSTAALISFLPALVLASPMVSEVSSINLHKRQAGEMALTPFPVLVQESSNSSIVVPPFLIWRLRCLSTCRSLTQSRRALHSDYLPRTDRMSTDYTYGDGKTYDSANFGVFKQNWGMLRASTSRYRGKSSNDWNTGSEMNSNLCLDINLRHESSNYYGEGTWFAGHRNGASGLANPNTQDIQNYKDAIYWIRNQLEYYNGGKDKTSDVRFWVNVPAI